MELDQVWVPGACTLPTVEQPVRVAEFDALFTERLIELRRPSGTEAELVLRGGPHVAQEVQDLADRETACCSFFRFTLETAGDDLVLRVAVPATQARVLSALADRAEIAAAAR